MADAIKWSAETLIAKDGTVSVISADSRTNTPIEDLLAVSTLLAFFGFVWAFPFLFISVVVAVFFWSRTAIALVALLTALSFLPPGDIWWAYRRLPLWDCWRRYFTARLVTPPKDKFLRPDGHYLFAEFPHTVYPMASWLGLPICGIPESGLPYNLRGGIASVMFQLPIVKHNYAWAGCMPADYKRMLAHLRQPGASLSVIPEGIAGIFLASDRSTESIFLSRRKGFIKLAIQGGADLLPVYHLGQSQLLTFWGTEEWSRKYRISLGIFWGAYYLPLPRRHPIISLIGAPIPVKQDDHPSQEAIDALHAQFTAAIRKLFDDHKHLLGPEWAKKELRIL